MASLVTPLNGESMRTIVLAILLGILGALLGAGVGNVPGLTIVPAFALFGGLLAAILGAVIGGVLDITVAIRQTSKNRPAGGAQRRFRNRLTCPLGGD